MKIRYFIVLLLIAFVACNNKKKEEDLKVKVVPQDTVKVAETPAPPTTPPVEKVDKGVNLDDKYFLVASTNHVKAFADSWNKKYQQEGYNSNVVMRNEDGLYHVAVQSFKKFDLAKKALEDLRQKDGFSNAWIMVIDK